MRRKSDPIDINLFLRRVRRVVRHFKVPSVTQVAWKKDPYAVLVSTLISLRTKDDVTARASQRLLGRAADPRKMSRLPESRIAELIYPAGFYRNKARTIRAVSKAILERHGGLVPDDLETLLELKGVGRKTANLVLTLGFGKPGICVDIHVHRISNRWGYIETSTPDESEQALRDKLPRRHWIPYNDLLVTFGQNICAPVSPKCTLCPLHELCPRVGVERHR